MRKEDRSSSDGAVAGLTPFREKVYAQVRKIPAGYVSTYGDLAKQLRTSARAVGGAMRNNPFAPEVPWHRVVAADRKLGGFGGQWGKDMPKVKRKRSMLMKEGVVFDALGRVEKQCMYNSMTKKRKVVRDKNKQTTNVVATNTNNLLEKEILILVKKRGINKTCWPSEIPRKVYPANWRNYMEETRTAARTLAEKGKIDVLKKGKVLHPKEAYRGPIRLRLRKQL